MGVRVAGLVPALHDPKPFMATQALKVTKFNSKLSELWRKGNVYGRAGKYEKTYIYIVNIQKDAINLFILGAGSR